ncbi:hypothetical protein P3G55_20380 [Leptospira sp. 96542]|nr:hypothetical protein [Leptospira sp. 96542]
MLDLVIQNTITWFFSLSTFGLYGVYFVTNLLWENGFGFLFRRTHYVLELFSILLQVIAFLVTILFYLSGVHRPKFVYYLLLASLLLMWVSSIVESLVP